MNLRILLRLIAFVLTFLLIFFFPWDLIEIPWLYRVLYYGIEFVLFVSGTELAKHIFAHYYRKKKHLKPNSNDNFIEALNNLHYIIIFFAVLTTLLSFFDIHIIDVITSLSIVAAAIAIVSKEYVSNIMSGLLTAFGRELEIGDNIQILHHKGKVHSFSLSKVVLLNDDDDVVFIPNNLVFSTDFTNYSKRRVKKTSIDFDLNVKFMRPAEEIEKFLGFAIEDYLEMIDPKSIYLRIEEVKAEYVSFKFQYILLNGNRELEREIRRKVKRQIVLLLK